MILRKKSTLTLALLLGVTGVPFASAGPVVTDVFTDAGTTQGVAHATTGLALANNVTVNAAGGILVLSLGIYDYQLDGLAFAHTVSLYNITGGTSSPPLLASVTLPAGTSATLDNGFRYITLSDPVFLAENTKVAVVAYQLDGNGTVTGDPYADNATFVSNNGALTYSGNSFNFNNVTSGYPNGSNNPSDVFGAASFQYEMAPEPGSLALLAVGAAALFSLHRRLRA